MPQCRAVLTAAPFPSNVQGAGQPAFMHIGAEPGMTAPNGRKAGRGVGVVRGYDAAQSGWVLEIEGARMLLGVWWAHAAARGAVEQLPVLNDRGG